MKNSKNQVGDKFKVLWNGIKAGLTNPKILKLNNFRILWRALRTESPKKIIENLYKLVSRTRQLEAFQDSDTPISYHVDEAIVLFGFLSVRGWVVTKEKLKSIQLLLSNGEIIDVAFSDKQADMLGVMTPKKGQILNSFLTKVAFDTEKKTEEVILKIIDVIGNKIENQLEIKIEEDYSKLTLNQQYQLFLADNEWTEQDDERIKKEAGKFSYEPLISIITPVYNVAPVYLDACIESVLNQFYHNWELCLYDDASTKPETIATLKKWKGYDERIKITFGQENQHISGASNHAIAISKGEFVGLLDHDDVLTPDALHEVIKALNKNKNLDFIYSDEDKMELDGSLADPHFKPDYNPDLLLSTNYICHFSVIRRSLGEQIGWFRKGFEGAQDYDLFLRIVEKTAAIYHIPKVLYHWRKVAESTAAGDGGKGYTDRAAKQVLEETLKRRGLEGSVKFGIFSGTFHIEYTLKTKRVVSIIVPFKDQVDLLKSCISSILNNTVYSNLEILLVDNNSEQEDTFDYVNTISKKHPFIHSLKFSEPFNFSKINNWAVSQAKGDCILLLNNDIEVITKGWLTRMLSHLEREAVGAVGAKLLYPDDTVQHGGVIVGIGGVAGHAHKHLKRNHQGYVNRALLTQNLSACTAACLLVKKDVYEKVEGLEERLKVAFNDVDFCLKIRQKGYLIVFEPEALLYHYESKSRGLENNPMKQKRFAEEVDFFQKKWEKQLKQGDQYYNPNLNIQYEELAFNLSKVAYSKT